MHYATNPNLQYLKKEDVFWGSTVPVLYLYTPRLFMNNRPYAGSCIRNSLEQLGIFRCLMLRPGTKYIGNFMDFGGENRLEVLY